MSCEPELLAYAANIHIACSGPRNADDWFKAAVSYFDSLTLALKEPGVVIGHIKGFLELDNGAYAYLSNAGKLATDLRCAGEGCALTGKLGFNVLLYGSGDGCVACAVEGAMAALAKELNAKCILEKAAEK